MAEQTTSTGTGFIHGRITQGMGFAKNIGDPVPGLDVKAGHNPGGQMITSTTTSDTTANDGGGYFYFPNLPLGSYNIYADIPGLSRDSVITVILTVSNPQALQVNYVADSNSVSVPLTNVCSVNTKVTYSNDTLTAVRHGVDVTYQWYDCTTSSMVAGATNQSFTTSNSGTYQVQIDDFGCIGFSNCYSLVSVGVAEQNNNTEFDISPNPFTSQTTISFNKTQKNTTIKIMDVLGKEIKTVLVSGKSLTIEKGTMQSGIYFVQLIDDKKNVVNKKIVIQ